MSSVGHSTKVNVLCLRRSQIQTGWSNSCVQDFPGNILSVNLFIIINTSGVGKVRKAASEEARLSVWKEKGKEREKVKQQEGE